VFWYSLSNGVAAVPLDGVFNGISYAGVVYADIADRRLANMCSQGSGSRERRKPM
jgi:hypothetical protein